MIFMTGKAFNRHDKLVEDKSKTPRSKTAGRPLESVLGFIVRLVSGGKGSAGQEKGRV